MSQNLPWTWRRKTAFASTVGVVTLVLADLAIWALAGIPHPYAAGPVSPDEYVLDEFRRAPINRYVPSYHSPMLRLELKLDEKNLPGLSRTAQFTLNRFGFRSNRLVRVSKQPGVVRIFCVGGSTTECLYLDDQDAWPEVLQRLLASEALGVDVVNVGRSGDTTRDHISLLAHRILPFEPDIVIFLIGLNDLRLHMEPDYSPIRTDSRSVLPEPEVDIRVWVQARICNWSQLVRAAVWAKRRLVSADEQGNPVQDAHGVWIERARQQRRSRTLRKIDPHRYPFPEYSQNLRSLIGLCQANGALPVLMTQPALWGADSDAIEEYLWVCHPSGYRISHDQLWETLERFNSITREIGATYDCPVVDLAQCIPKTTEAFYDDDHFNISGARLVASEIKAVLTRDQRVRKRLLQEK